MVYAVGGVLRVARNERRARLVNAEQAAEVARLTRQQQRHAVVRFNAALHQVCGDDIRFVVELVVCKNSVLSYQSGLISVFGNDVFKQLVKQNGRQLGGLDRAVLFHFSRLILGQPGRLAHGFYARFGEHIYGVLYLRDKVLNHLILKQLGRILHHEAQTVRALADDYADIAAHFLQRRVKLNAQTVFIVSGRIPHEVDAYIEHRVAALVALLDEFFYNVLERQERAVGHSAHRFADLLDIIGQRQSPLRLNADRRGVDEHADNVVGSVRTGVCGDTEHNVLACGVFAERHGDRREYQLKLGYRIAARGVVDLFQLFVIIIKDKLSVRQRMHLRALALERHLVNGHAVLEQLAVERKPALVLFVEAVVVKIGKVYLGRFNSPAVQTVDKLFYKSLGRTAVKGDVMYRKMQDDAAVGYSVQSGDNGDAGVQVKGHGVSVHLGDDFLAAAGGGFDDIGQLVGQYAHRQTVLFPVEGVERLVRLEYGVKRTLNAVDIGALDDSGYVKIVYGGVGIKLLLQIHPALKGRQRIDLNLCLTFFDLLLGSLLYQQTLYHSRSLARENNGCGDFVYIALGSHHSALDGISAEGKEIVVDTDVFNGQHLFKSVAKRLLHVGLRRGVIALEGSCLGSFQRSPVQLAVSVYGQLV